MKVLVVSDTHRRHENFIKVIDELEKDIDYVIHCGDVEGEEDYLESLLKCPITFVQGNNDFFTFNPPYRVINYQYVNVFVTHGHRGGVAYDPFTLVDMARDDDCQIAVFGHTHRPYYEVKNGIHILNPGSISYPRQGGGIPTYAIINITGPNEFNIELKEVR